MTDTQQQFLKALKDAGGQVNEREMAERLGVDCGEVVKTARELRKLGKISVYVYEVYKLNELVAAIDEEAFKEAWERHAANFVYVPPEENTTEH